MPKLRLLIAEDIPATVRLYTSALNADLFEIHVAEDGQQALELYRQVRPDIILLDIMMPLLSGFSVLKTIRSKDKDVTIIMATSKSYSEDVEACAKLGVQGYVVKPFDRFKLDEQILQAYASLHPDKASQYSLPAADTSTSSGLDTNEVSAEIDNLLKSLE